MFVGHFGVALAAKKVAPRPSLGTLTLAALLADGISAIFLLLGWEKVEIHPGITAVSPLEFVSYPYSHSLVAGVFWAALVAGAYYLRRRDRRGALWLAALVLSHWILDFISHGPDMPVGLELRPNLVDDLVVRHGNTLSTDRVSRRHAVWMIGAPRMASRPGSSQPSTSLSVAPSPVETWLTRP